MGTETIAREYLHYHFWKEAFGSVPYILEVGLIGRVFGTNNHEALILACNFIQDKLRDELINWYKDEHYHLQGPEQGSTIYTSYYLEAVLSNLFFAIKKRDKLIEHLSRKWLNNSYYLWSLGNTKIPAKDYGTHFNRIIIPGTRSSYLHGDVVTGATFHYMNKSYVPDIDLGINVKHINQRITALSMLRFLAHEGVFAKGFFKDKNFGLMSTMKYVKFKEGFYSTVPSFKKVQGGPIWAVRCKEGKTFITIDWTDVYPYWKKDGKKGANRWGGRTKDIPLEFQSIWDLGEALYTKVLKHPATDFDEVLKELKDKEPKKSDTYKEVLPCLVKWAYINRDPMMIEAGLDGKKSLDVIFKHPTSLLYDRLRRLYEEMTGEDLPNESKP